MSKSEKNLLNKILVSLVLFLIGIIIHNEIVSFSIFIIAYLLVGYDVVRKAFSRIFKGKFLDENFLMTIATFGAFIIGEYTEAVAVMLFYQTGELFQSYSVSKSRRSISELMEICPEYAYVEKEGNVIKCSPEEVLVGDILVIKPGEKVPVDGTIVKGTTSFNTSALTGESIPKTAETGDCVCSGFINIEGLVKIRAEKEYADSTVAKILELVENSSMSKARTERFITRFSAFYTPVVVILALCLAIIPSIFLGNVSMWIYRALSFLVISCPCALVISVPLSFFGGIGGASRNGILIKGANFIEALAECKTFAFDKTGTLTKGQFEVDSISPAGISEEDFVFYLSLAEGGSNHPIAQAIIQKFGNVEKEAEIFEIPGRGIKALFDGKEILAGNKKLLSENGIDGIDCPDIVGTVIFLAVDKKFSGYAVISDSVKDEGEKAIKQMYSYGIDRVVILTGDTEENVKAVAERISVKEYRAGCLPADKVNAVKELIDTKKGKVAFAGDGINDAPVLALADVGVAMGGVGSDAAIEAADIVIMDDNLLKIPVAMRIAKKTMRIVRENIAFALGVKGAVLILSAFGITNMWAAVFADVGVAVIAILNAMRTLKKAG